MKAKFDNIYIEIITLYKAAIEVQMRYGRRIIELFEPRVR
jgi:hypothetical protein